MDIQFIEHHLIDKKLWDNCLLNSEKYELYMQSSYLDIVFPKWKALVAGNYEAIIPICEKRFFFWQWIVQPYYTGAWQVVGTNKNAINKLKEYIPDFLKNYTSIFIKLKTNIAVPSFKQTQAKYQQLILEQEEFQSDKQLKKNINKATKNGIDIPIPIDSDTFIKNLKDTQKKGRKIHSDSKINLLSKLLNSKALTSIRCYAVHDKEEKICAAQLFLTINNRIFFITCFTTKHGKTISALHYLQYKLIEKYLTKGGVLHFGGSNIQKVAEFNYNFNSADIYYYTYQVRKFPMNLLKF